MYSITSFFTKTLGINSFYTIEGTYEYHIDIEIKGQEPYTGSDLIIHAFTNSTKRTEISLEYRWFRERSLSREHIKVEGNTYKTSALDAGCYIHAELMPIGLSSSQIATIKFGPFVLDLKEKRTIQGYLTTGNCCFLLDSISEREP